MGIRDTLGGLFGRKVEPEPVVETPSVAELLAPTDVMKTEWRKDARAESEIVSDMTRAELGREYGGQLFLDELPASGEPRRQRVEDILVMRSVDLYADHLVEVARVFALPDAELNRVLWAEEGEIPGLDRPRERAEYISTSLLETEQGEREIERNFWEREADRRLSPVTSNDWHEHKAGEPAILDAERSGDADYVDVARTSYLDRFQLRDPSLKEIAATVVDASDRWDELHASDRAMSLSSGPIRLTYDAAARLVSTQRTSEPGVNRDRAIVDSFVDDYPRRFPEAREAWNWQAMEVIAEGSDFVRARYGVQDASFSIADVVTHEAMREVSKIRLAQGVDQGMDVGVKAPDRSAPDVQDVDRASRAPSEVAAKAYAGRPEAQWASMQAGRTGI